MSPTSRVTTLRRLAWCCVLLMLAVTTASAWLRLAQPRAHCHDWPGCRDEARPPGALVAAGTPRPLDLTRVVHRIAASTVLVAVVALVALALRQRQRTVVRDALALLALALGLALLGVVTPGSRAAAVLLGNLVGGLLMLALSWRMLRSLQAAPAVGAPLAAAARTAMLLWLAQAALGALSGAGLSGSAPVWHLALALTALPLAFGVGWAARLRRRAAEGDVLIALAALQGLLGAASAAGAAAAPLVLAHNAAAAAGVALLCGLTMRGTTDPPAA